MPDLPPSPPPAVFPDRLNTFLTTEHFTLQSARSLLTTETFSRVTIYFTTLSSVLIAASFLAQVAALTALFGLFVAIAFPVVVILGLLTLARLMIVSAVDGAYIAAINRIRQFYVQAAPEARQFLFFPAHDDLGSVQLYGGYGLGFRGGLLSAAHMVMVTNSMVATVLLSLLISRWAGLPPADFWPYGLGVLAVVYGLHVLIGYALARPDLRREYDDVRFPAPKV